MGNKLIERINEWRRVKTVENRGQPVENRDQPIEGEIILPNAIQAIFNRSQDDITREYLQRESVSRTIRFGRNSGAYPFTNEPMGDLLDADLNLEGPALTVTASGDILCMLAGLGAKQIVSVDISKHANAWSEYKFEAFKNLEHDKFMNIFPNSYTNWKNFPFELDVSDEARKTFKYLSKSGRSFGSTSGVFNSYGCFGPNSAGYCGKEAYERMAKVARDTNVRFFPADFGEFFTQESDDLRFTSSYLSNMLDHMRDEKHPDKHDFSSRRMLSIIGPLSERMDKDGTMIINIQWGDRAKKGIESALSKVDYKLKRVKSNGDYNACGSMYIAKRK